MKRYQFLVQTDIYEALNRLRDAFLAAKNGHEVDEIINALLTSEEKLQLGRRILIAQGLQLGLTQAEIISTLKVGKVTVSSVYRKLLEYPKGFELLEARREQVERTYSKEKFKSTGGSKLVKKRKIYSGVTRKDVKR